MSIFDSHPKRLVFRTNKVFVPGGLPTLTYNPRKALDLESHLRKALDNLCKLVMVTGSTKSGKTVLTTTVFPKQQSIWFDGGSFTNEDDFWIDIANALGCTFEETTTQNKANTNTDTVSAGISKNLLIVKAELKGSTEGSSTEGTSTTRSFKRTAKTTALQELKDTSTPLIIDDFHYIPRESQANIVRALKANIFEGAPVIFLAIPHRRLDAVKVEREMTGRVDNVQVPAWDDKELSQIAFTGFPLLNMNVDNSIINRFADEAIGSPHLMQEFCRMLCSNNGIDETVDEEVIIKNAALDELFKRVAEGTGKIMFDKLSKGPRQRSDRLKRGLKSGHRTDIYGLVLQGLAELKPGMEKVDYEELRTKIRDISADKPPEAHEISRVLEHMSNIASSDESSTPVLDWEKEERILHITDPFFAYYLRWGIEAIKSI